VKINEQTDVQDFADEYHKDPKDGCSELAVFLNINISLFLEILLIWLNIFKSLQKPVPPYLFINQLYRIVVITYLPTFTPVSRKYLSSLTYNAKEEIYISFNSVINLFLHFLSEDRV
jgi:hypothetical protein